MVRTGEGEPAQRGQTVGLDGQKEQRHVLLHCLAESIGLARQSDVAALAANLELAPLEYLKGRLGAAQALTAHPHIAARCHQIHTVEPAADRERWRAQLLQQASPSARAATGRPARRTPTRGSSQTGEVS